jgi:RNA-directed DNA polymerase
VYRVFRALGYTKAVSALLAGLVTLNGCLPQGAPTSPTLSNLICARIDFRLAGYCIRRHWRYTRYADDIAVSGDASVKQAVRVIESVIRDEGFVLHGAKTRVRFSHQQQLVTGLVVNQGMQAPRTMRRALRQAAYFIQRFGLSEHMQHLGITQANYRAHLTGLAHHVLFVNARDRDAAMLVKVLRS